MTIYTPRSGAYFRLILSGSSQPPPGEELKHRQGSTAIRTSLP